MIRTHTHNANLVPTRLYRHTELEAGELYRVVQPESRRGTLVLGVGSTTDRGVRTTVPVVIHDEVEGNLSTPSPTVLRNDTWRMVLVDKGTQVTITAE
ncbi:hypothetical protein ABTNL_12 [Pseudomonas phage vB_PaeP_PPA-ABTNL]|uniref:Uncharacterized protein n=3 Tax=Phikmvvirus TaxID=477967 RepID=A0A0B4N5H0_9CAUD|nr:hypothetical protein ACQ50_gp12 [Pseudomonas phage vB_PaeP_PPA-ABTNL]AIK67573.1 hypothetical protein ABTNL_12 [Pseudomonas phage vB_PaeP_PPA-ABTNL]QQL99184.1 hypothetical protein [Pseudomonas phage HX1]WOZ53299.1 hypothetical protein [Pseudomonas phage PA69]